MLIFTQRLYNAIWQDIQRTFYFDEMAGHKLDKFCWDPQSHLVIVCMWMYTDLA